MLAYGDMRELTEEELARAVQLDPSQIAGLGPSLEALMEMLRERKRKILATYETERVQARPPGGSANWPREMKPPKPPGRALPPGRRAKSSSTTWSGCGIAPTTSSSPFARQLVQLVDRLGDKYQVDELAAKYEFTGRDRHDDPARRWRSRRSWKRSTGC